jgi:hypothetical protein
MFNLPVNGAKLASTNLAKGATIVKFIKTAIAVAIGAGLTAGCGGHVSGTYSCEHGDTLTFKGGQVNYLGKQMRYENRGDSVYLEFRPDFWVGKFMVKADGTLDEGGARTCKRI